MSKFYTCLISGLFCCFLTSCSGDRPKVHVQALQEWGHGPVHRVTDNSATMSQAAVALCLHDTKLALDTENKGWDSWPTRRRLAPCMQVQGMEYLNNDITKKQRPRD